MSLLKLSNIGKIYVSENNVTVGIREINLSFDRGEFAVVTGKSGSGKSTLLNVISGMDSFEEGELFISGNPTSHYLQTDWEDYRQKYISFIFQDYNIIDSFTVLENVELALMHIDDLKERRKRALELIDRVGLSSHVKHKGSKLSGGQKQRTVIARALAKDSPIILADEPTGNLDSQTSKEIIELLHQVSKDKLVIVVTHNFDDFSAYATRHIRIHDGSLEFDHEILPADICNDLPKEKSEEKPLKKNLKDGVHLGVAIFKSKPKLTAFLCLLMMIGTVGLFFVTTLSGGAADVFKTHYMFNDIEGRLVVTTKSGRVIEEKEIEELATKYGAESFLKYDSLLEETEEYTTVMVPSNRGEDGYRYLSCRFAYNEYFGDDIIGRYPEAKDEVFLYLPISYAQEFGKDELKISEIPIFNLPLKVSGVKYYYDNNKPAKCLFNKEGFEIATAASYMIRCGFGITVSMEDSEETIVLRALLPSFDIPDDKAYILSPRYSAIYAENPDVTPSVNFNAVYYTEDIYSGSVSNGMVFSRDFSSEEITHTAPTYAEQLYVLDSLVISDEIFSDIAYNLLKNSYKQASLFFENYEEAYRVAELLNAEDYIAVPADTTYTDKADTAVFALLESAITAVFWVIAVIFLAFFINLCSLRAVESFKSDIAIMRSMGIKVIVIKVGIYVRMALCLIPAFVLLAALSASIYTSVFNQYFKYLYAWQYAAIILGMVILTFRTTKKQIYRLFSNSVKKTIKGGDRE